MSEDFTVREADRDFVAAALHHYSKTLRAVSDVASLVQDTSAAGVDLVRAAKRADDLSRSMNPPVFEHGVIVGMKFPRP